MRRLKILGSLLLVICSCLAITAYQVIRTEQAVDRPELTEAQVLKERETSRKFQKRQKQLHNAIADYFERAIASGDIVGAGVSIVKGDSIIVATGFGKRSVGRSQKVDGETLFRLGSLSKGFAGVLAAQLQAKGNLDWKDKVTDYLPQFQLGNPTNTSKITVGHILSHTAGTPYHSFTNLVEAGLPIESIAARFSEVRPISEPGELYSYQNAMFALSQEIMHKATGKEVRELLNNRFFGPLDMKTVSMDHNVLMKSTNVALPHTKSQKGWKSRPLKDRYYNAVVAGGIDASALDMAKWMRFLLGHHPEVMPKEDIAKAFQPVIALNDNNKYYQRWEGHQQSYYGFGWRIHQFQDTDTKIKTTMWHHGGSVNNYRNEIALYPDGDFGICVLLNGNSKLARTVVPDMQRLIQKHFEILE
ncbi:serine hydrolase domain-containing protein [Maribacter sp. 2-571]|uniref:serine hydrolase domain-containing protein n=1 Tax=Maribacter sp. 2-571 TaxID=3417569 RepID=UPI003D33C11B